MRDGTGSGVRAFCIAGALSLLAGHCGGVTRNTEPSSTDAAADAPTTPDPRFAPPVETPDGQAAIGPGLCDGNARPKAGRAPPAEHRAEAAACPASGSGVPTADGGGGDGGDSGAACSEATDCQTDGTGSSGPSPYCVGGRCSRDQCFTDADCPSSSVCACAANKVGDNLCIASGCRVDADCGAGEYCVPSRGYCGGIEGFYCTTAEDTCVDEVLNCNCGSPAANACTYAPQVGRWVCGRSYCAG